MMARTVTLPFIPKKVENFLFKLGIKYEATGHRKVYTAFDKAATLKVKPATIAKVLVLKLDKELALAAVGGDRNLDIDKLHKTAKVEKIDFAKEKVIGETFKGIDPGAIPPFGGLWQMKVFCDKKLLESAKIIVSAGNYETSLKMAPGAFKKINPEMTTGNFSSPRTSLAGAIKSKNNKPKAIPKKKPAKIALKKRKK